MKVAIVVQRYGATINGGAELHARYIAERLAKHVEVEVLTTCAIDYITWRNELTAATESVNGITVRRFPVTRERNPREFAVLSERVFTERHSVNDELAWLDAEGPTSPALVAHIEERRGEFDFFIFFSFRYYHAFYGARAVSDKAIVVPTAERDGALGLSIFQSVFRGVRGFMYNSYEERALIQAIADGRDVPGVVVGVGSEIPPHASGARFRQKFNFRERFAIYVGRIDENKGCGELFDFFQRYTRMFVEGMHLVLIGNPIIAIPQHPRIHHLGFLSDHDKFDALAAAELLVMPSYLESLSMVALEAWALGKPVLANGRCDVLRGQCIRSNGGLYYDSFLEFIETLRAIDFDPALAGALGRNGRDYYNRHYTWPIIERKYLDMLDRLSREPRTVAIDPLPGWLVRRRKALPPANAIVAALPSGPAVAGKRDAMRSEPSVSAPAPRGPAERTEQLPQPPVRVAGGRSPGRGRPLNRDRGLRRAGARPHSQQRRHGSRPRRRSGNR